jgi:hypothetical protein
MYVFWSFPRVKIAIQPHVISQKYILHESIFVDIIEYINVLAFYKLGKVDTSWLLG